MVAAAADIIVLNGQGITNLPWLFRLADRTHVILQQVGISKAHCGGIVHICVHLGWLISHNTGNTAERFAQQEHCTRHTAADGKWLRGGGTLSVGDVHVMHLCVVFF
jgi:hypothetical protein